MLNPNRTDPDIDTGSLDPIIAPYVAAQEVTMQGAQGPATFNDLPIMYSAGIKGGVSPTGSAGVGYTWTYTAASLTADPFDYYSVQTGDDTADSQGMGTLGFGGVINAFSLTMDDTLSPFQVSQDWICAGATYGNRTNSLNVDSAPAFVFGADTTVYLDSVAGSIGVTPIASAVRGIQLTVTNNLDQKRYANGSNTRFNLSDYGRGPRQIELVLTVEKTAAMITEATTLDDTPTPNRYIKIGTASTETAGGATKYSSNIFLPMRLYSWTEGEIGGNSNIQLTYHGFYDSTTTYAFKAVTVNSLSALP